MDGWVPADLTGCHVVMRGMEGKAEDVISVGGVEPLLMGGTCVDHAQCCNVVDYVSVFGVKEVVATIVTTITEKKKILIKARKKHKLFKLASKSNHV